MTLILTALVAAIGALALVIGAYYWLNRRRIANAQQLRERLTNMGSSGVVAGAAPILRTVKERNSILDRVLADKSFTAVVEDEMRRGGVAWTAGQFGGYVLAGMSAGLLSAFWVPFIWALPFGVAGALAPFVIVSQRRKRRERRIEEQLPEAVEMLVNSMKAGFSLQAGMNFVGSELPAPVGPEFARFYDEQRLGIDVKQALLGLQERLGTLDARMLVLAMLIQRETGGNLAEILNNISRMIRERISFRDHVNVLTAESKLSATILSLLPVLLYFVISYSNPEYMNDLTSTSTGKMLLAYAGASLVVGFFMLQKMSKVES